MSSIRRRSASPSSPSSDSRSPVRRQTSLKVTRQASSSRSGAGRARTQRVKIESSALNPSAPRARASAARTRRATPIVRRSLRLSPSEEDTEDEADGPNQAARPPTPYSDEPADASSRARGRRQVRANVEVNAHTDSNGRFTRTARVSSYGTRGSASDLSWYDRLMPECVLNVTAPLTGYETRLESDVEDEDYEILERQRLRRNKRVRRRLLTILLMATAASVFFYSKGRFLRSPRSGVRAAISSMTKKVEDGISKSIHGIENLAK